ncbi:hypothetical protein ACFFGH_17800 [Lysobacter korlensis]|uniref:Uncharacterized protein n=1 Tax=Lysobacter korlensis TaxID=553636 RepID=A0ABV6RSC5_9GAMM
MISKRSSTESSDLNRGHGTDVRRQEGVSRDGDIDAGTRRDATANGVDDDAVERGIATRYVVPNGVDRPQQDA